MIRISVNTRHAYKVYTEMITSGSSGIPVSFIFSSDWDGLTKIASFRGSGVGRDMVLTGDTAVVPYEVLTTAGGELMIGVYGTDGQDGAVIIPTIWADVGRIREGVHPCCETDPQPTASVIDQVLTAAMNAVEQADEAAKAQAEIAAGHAEDAANSASAAAGSATAAAESAASASASKTAAAGSASAAHEDSAAAVSAKNAAETAQGIAEEARDTAVSAKNAAETAQRKAETAQGKAETAKTAAEAAARSASESASSASASAIAAGSSATSAAGSASAAHTDAAAALEAKNTAVSAKDTAVAAKDTAVASKIAAEAAQGAAGNAATNAAGSATAAANSATAAAASAASAAEVEARAEEVAESIPEDYSELSDDVVELKSAVTETQIINFDDYQTVNYGITTGNNWNYDSSYRACSVPVTDNVAKITVTANENLPALFALVQLIDYADGRAVTYATGEYRRTLNAGETVTIDVPDDCHYLWVLKSNDGGSTIKTPSATSFYLVKKTPLVDETLSISGDAADAKVTGDHIKEIHGKIGITESLEVTRVRSGYINYSTGAATNTSGSTSYTYHVNISAFESLIYSRLYSTSSSSNAGMAFYDEGGTYISGQRCAIKQSSTHYELTEIAVPEDAVTARFTQHDSLTGFVLIGKLKGYAETSLQGQIDTLDDDLHKLVPPPSKRVSILGDSISTFASPYESFEGSKWAPEGCVTNYPGNRLRYPDGDITEVNQLWWKIVIDYFGWSLGINDSWAGSRISWDGTEDTDSTHTRPSHVGENIYFGSPTRIGHLGENGTPDIIFIFGGTNDINHLATSQIGTLPTDDPSGYDQTALDALAVDTFKDAVTAMVLRMQYAYPSAKIIALLPYYVTDNYSGKTPYTVKVFDDAMIECYDYLGVEHIDLRKTMSIYNIHNVLADDLHPNAAYMRVIADAVIKHILDTVS